MPGKPDNSSPWQLRSEDFYVSHQNLNENELIARPKVRHSADHEILGLVSVDELGASLLSKNASLLKADPHILTAPFGYAGGGAVLDGVAGVGIERIGTTKLDSFRCAAQGPSVHRGAGAVAVGTDRVGVNERAQASGFSLLHSGLHDLISRPSLLEFAAEDISETIGAIESLLDPSRDLYFPNVSDIGLQLHIRAQS